MDLILDSLDIRDYFDACVTGEDVSKSKPAPDTFLKAAERLNLSPDRCVVIEDAIHGVQAGKAAGMVVVALTTTRKRHELTEADLIVDSLNEHEADTFVKLLNA